MAVFQGVYAGMLDPAIAWIWIIIVPVVGGLGLGLVSMLLQHQKNMAQIMRGQAEEGTASEIAALRQEVLELKSMLQQALVAGSYQTPTIEPEQPPLHVTTRE